MTNSTIHLTHEQLGSIYKPIIICMKCGRCMVKMGGYQMGLRDVIVGCWDCRCGNRIDLVQNIPYPPISGTGKVPAFDVNDLLGWEGLSDEVRHNLKAALKMAKKEMDG